MALLLHIVGGAKHRSKLADHQHREDGEKYGAAPPFGAPYLIDYKGKNQHGDNLGSRRIERRLRSNPSRNHSHHEQREDGQGG